MFCAMIFAITSFNISQNNDLYLSLGVWWIIKYLLFLMTIPVVKTTKENLPQRATLLVLNFMSSQKKYIDIAKELDVLNPLLIEHNLKKEGFV